MAKGPPINYEEIRGKTLHTAAKMFLEQGYTDTTVRGIAKAAGVNVSSMVKVMGSKESILLELVAYVLENQFAAAGRFLAGETDDPILFYAAETTLQLYMVESHERLRELYGAAYSLPRTTELIQDTITDKLTVLFKAHLPELSREDFYLLEIASGGIMREFMAQPCRGWLTMEKKVEAFLTTTFRVYCVPDEKIREAVRFVSRFDYPALAQETIDSMLTYLESSIQKKSV